MKGLIPAKTFLVNTGEHAANLLVEADESEIDVGSAKLVERPSAVRRLKKERTAPQNPGATEAVPI